MRSFTVPRGQWLFARLYLGVLKPKRAILGMELSGEVEAVGRDVTRFKVGDLVFASTFEADFGGYAEYKCLPEDGLLAIKPAGLTFEEAAAAVGGGMTGFRCLERGRIQSGQSVLIYGASRFGRDECGPTCQEALRGGSDRRMQRCEPGIGEVAGSRPGP